MTSLRIGGETNLSVDIKRERFSLSRSQIQIQQIFPQFLISSGTYQGRRSKLRFKAAFQVERLQSKLRNTAPSTHIPRGSPGQGIAFTRLIDPFW